jgi:hypothetical protein
MTTPNRNVFQKIGYNIDPRTNVRRIVEGGRTVGEELGRAIVYDDEYDVNLRRVAEGLGQQIGGAGALLATAYLSRGAGILAGRAAIPSSRFRDAILQPRNRPFRAQTPAPSVAGSSMPAPATTLLGGAVQRGSGAVRRGVEAIKRNIRTRNINPEDHFLRPPGYVEPTVGTATRTISPWLNPMTLRGGFTYGLAPQALPMLPAAAEMATDFLLAREPGTTQLPESADRVAAGLTGVLSSVGAAGLGRAALMAPGRLSRLGNIVGSASLGTFAIPRLQQAFGLGKYGEDEAAPSDIVSAPEQPAAPAAAQVPPPVSQLDMARQIQEDALRAYEQDLIAEDQALDTLFEQALQESLNARGASTQADIASDPILQQELANINQSYLNAKQSIQNNYAAAEAQIQGYQTQADELMRGLAEEQLAGLEQAAGESMATATGTGLTPEQAAAAGVSPTAVGGAGVTGAGLIGSLGGVATAQSAANRMAVGSLLAEQLASGRLDEATLGAALEQSRLDAERIARGTSAERQAQERAIARQANIEAADLRLRAVESRRAEAASKREAVAAARLQGDQRLADRIASMSPEEYRRFVGGDVSAAAPSWAVKSKNPPANATSADLDKNDRENTILQIYANRVGLILASGMDRTQAIIEADAVLTNLEAQYAGSGIDVLALLREAGLPTTPEAIVKKTLG